MAKKKEITLQEHLAGIAASGGEARAAKLSSARKKAIAKKGGKAGGAARAESLTAKRRSEIAKAAAAKRWANKEVD